MCLSNISGLEFAILNFYFRPGRKLFPIGEWDTVFKDHSNNVSQTILLAVLDKNPRGWWLVADVAKKSRVARRLTLNLPLSSMYSVS